MASSFSGLLACRRMARPARRRSPGAGDPQLLQAAVELVEALGLLLQPSLGILMIEPLLQQDEAMAGGDLVTAHGLGEPLAQVHEALGAGAPVRRHQLGGGRGGGARRSAAKSLMVTSTSCPTALTTGMAEPAMARATASSLKHQRSSREPPPRPTMSTSTSARRLASMMAETIWAVALPCTWVG
jgi:hypothetical protein